MSSAEANVAKPTTLSESTIKAHKSVARRLALIAALGGLLYGYDSAVINGATNAIKTEFATGDALLGLAVGSALISGGIGALLAGLLASAWRSAVHHGLLAPHLGYPRICLTVPSIVIMVPGLYMYQAMFHLGQFDTLNALDWAFRAFMVILCLPIGLAMARVITDKSWRYDI